MPLPIPQRAATSQEKAEIAKRKVIITLKEAIATGVKRVLVVYCDSALADDLNSNLVVYKVDSKQFFIPVHNVLGVGENELFEGIPERVAVVSSTIEERIP